MAGKVVDIKVCGSHQHLLGLIAKSSEIRHYTYTKRSIKNKKDMKHISIIICLIISNVSFSQTINFKKVIDYNLDSEIEYLTSVGNTSNWSNVYPKDFELPKDLQNWKLIHSIIDYDQVVYQSCNGDIWSKDKIYSFINHWGLDTIGCSDKFINSFINGAIGEYKGQISYVIDENNNGDFSDDSIYALSDSINNNHQIIFERYINKKVTLDTVNIRVLAPYIDKKGEIKGIKYKYCEYRKGSIKLEGIELQVTINPGRFYLYHNKPNVFFIINEDTTQVTNNQFIKLNHYYEITDIDKKGYSLNLKKYHGKGIPESNQINYIAPDFQINDSLYLHNFRGKNVLLYFWNIDCGMCSKDLPETYDLINTTKNKDLEVVLVSVDKPTESEKFLQEKNINWINIEISGDNEIFKNYGIESFPYQFLINTDGLIESEGNFIDVRRFIK